MMTRMRRRWRVLFGTKCAFLSSVYLLSLLSTNVPFFRRFGYNTAGHGRWVSLQLRRKKRAGGGGGQSKKKKKAIAAALAAEADSKDDVAEQKKNEGVEGGEKEEKEPVGSDDEAMEEDSDDDAPKPWEIAKAKADAERRAAAAVAAAEAQAQAVADAAEAGLPPPKAPTPPPEEEEDDGDDPEKTIPGLRYNAMLAVQKNTLFMCVFLFLSFFFPFFLTFADAVPLSNRSYGGILEAGNREYTLADFHTLQLDKMDRFKCLREDQMCVSFSPFFPSFLFTDPLPFHTATPTNGTAAIRRTTTSTTLPTTMMTKARSLAMSGKEEKKARAKERRKTDLRRSRRNRWRSRSMSLR
jgi:hypothetical protein